MMANEGARLMMARDSSLVPFIRRLPAARTVPAANDGARLQPRAIYQKARSGAPFQPPTTHSSHKNTVIVLEPCAPNTSDCSISAVLEGPAMNVPKLYSAVPIRS